MDIIANKENAKEILVYAETKRIAENLTKKEMCAVIGINDNYYSGCVTGRTIPSQPMLESLVKYINMKTNDVYFKVFAFRSSPAFIGNKRETKFMSVGDNVFKEKYSKNMSEHETNFSKIVEILEREDVLRVPM